MSESQSAPTKYEDAVQELQDILQQLQQNELGVDELTAQLKRASLLLEFCQDKLQTTEAEVQSVLERLGLDASAPES